MYTFWHKRIHSEIFQLSSLILFLMNLFMLCAAMYRKSTKQRESPGTTSTTQTMWAVSISSARNPLACSTCWMKRASMNHSRHFTALINLFQLSINLPHIFFHIFHILLFLFYPSFLPPLSACVPAFPMPQMRLCWPNSSSNTGETNILYPHQSWSLPSSFDILLGKSNIKSR